MASNYISLLILFPLAGILVAGAVLVIMALLGYRAGDATGRRYDKWFC